MNPVFVILRYIRVLALASFLLFAGCGKRAETVYIISTNDIHGAIGMFPNLASLVEDYRGREGTLILVDAGDRWTGNPYVDRAQERGKPVTELMAALGYDVITLGNHEFDFGQEVLAARLAEVDIPVVLANADTRQSELPAIPPHMTVETPAGHKITFLGLVETSDNGHPSGHTDAYRGITFYPAPDVAAGYSHLSDSCDVFVALSHLGYDADVGLAASVPGLDLIIGGHSHTLLEEPERAGGVLITQAGSRLEYAGVTTIGLRSGEIVSITNRVVRLDTCRADPGYAAMVARMTENSELREVVGTMASRADKSGIMNLVTDLMRAETGADIALCHLNGIRLGELGPGDIELGDIYALEPFGATAVNVEMTVDGMRRLIVNKFNDTAKPSESHTADIFPSGMSYEIITDLNGNATDVLFDIPGPRKDKYRVAMSEYIYHNYAFDRPAALSASRLLTDMLIEFFGTSGPVTPDNEPRVAAR